VSHQRGIGRHSTPMIHYRGAEVFEALHNLRAEAGDPHEGIPLQFVNPVNCAPIFRTLNYAAQLLRPGEETQPKRETASTYYVVMEGSGYTEIGGKRFDWEPNDLFVVPNFLWRRHVNTGKKDAILYSVSDAALMQNIGQYRAQGRGRDGKVSELLQ
jgi:gentisate 1,2-dioxygenase